jgi:hypothetical protein
MGVREFLIALTLAASPAAALAEDVHIIGDSIGEGLHLATGIASPANRFNVAIYTGKAIDQLKQMPRGSTVVMSLGTNDAVGGLTDQKAKVEGIVAAAEAQGVKLVWVGPPCVLTKWQNYSKALDANLAATLKDSSVTYVSAQDPEFCTPSLHAGDGVHFTMAGYAKLWQKAATVAGIPVVVASTATHHPAATAAAAGSKPHRKKRHHGVHATKTPQPAPN